ncbi:MAG: hypothetical protein HXK82_02885 [Lachnospiraceae bacterium]|nr:hypothetical protein [Lachnospiraceae bacterium]
MNLPFYLELNDDALIQALSSGAFTGVPETHNIQMLFPGSLLLSLLYRLAGGIPWYGLLLLFLQALCVLLVLRQVFFRIRKGSDRVAAMILASGLFLTALYQHFLFLTYTFTAGMLSATAVLLILNDGDGKGTRGEKRKVAEREPNNRPLAIILVVIAFCLRSELLLLTFPFVLLAFLFRVDRFRRENGTGKGFLLYGRILLWMMGLMAVCFLSDQIAYSRKDWREFRALFDARTRLYDFERIPSYQENRNFYQTIGLAEIDVTLLQNYNFALDPKIDAEKMRLVAEEANRMEAKMHPPASRLKKAVSIYTWRLHHLALPVSFRDSNTDMPYLAIVLLLYLLVFLIMHRTGVLWKLVLLFLCRSTLWTYMIYNGRIMNRVMHSLLLVELFFLIGMVLPELGKEWDVGKKRLSVAGFIVLVAASLLFVPRQMRNASGEVRKREEFNRPYEKMLASLEQKKGFTFIDVYSSVDYTVKALGKQSLLKPTKETLAGGWAAKSPLYEKKLRHFGIRNMEEGLLQENVTFLAEKEEDLSWLTDYYRDRKENVTLQKQKQLAGRWILWKLKRVERDIR